jgi:hypothetical protein
MLVRDPYDGYVTGSDDADKASVMCSLGTPKVAVRNMLWRSIYLKIGSPLLDQMTLSVSHDVARVAPKLE